MQDEHINKEYIINFEGLLVEVRVLNARSMFGRKEYLITPVAGSGEKWIARTVNGLIEK
jgi:hypothetical protein